MRLSSTLVKRRGSVTPPVPNGSKAYRADRHRDPTPINTVALTVKTGVAMARLHHIPVKNHGRRARSLFALGLHTLRKIFVAASPAQIIAFLGQLLSPKLPVKPLRALAYR